MTQSALKTRFYVTASSLGTYFGKYASFGSTPLDQLEIDLGNEAAEFDDAANARMDLGKFLENSTLDYFEKQLTIEITERNQDFIYAFDNQLKGIVDGMTFYQGIKTGVECKISNSASGSFVENVGYVMQCQAYMEATGCDQWLLLGLQNGKPIWKILKRDQEMIDDIREMVETVGAILNGVLDELSFPWHLVEKYSNVKKAEPFEPDQDDITLFDEYLTKCKELDELKVTEKRVKELEDYFKESFTGEYTHFDGTKIVISEQTRAGGLDKDLLAIEHPELDLTKYSKPDSTFKKILVKKEKKAKS